MEMMIAVLILGVLVSIALPNYTDYVEQGDLEGARVELVRINQELTLKKVADPTFLEEAASKTAEQAYIAGNMRKEKAVTDKYNLRLMFPEARDLYILSAFPKVKSRTQVTFINAKGDAVKCKTAEAATALIQSNTKLNSATGDCEPF